VRSAESGMGGEALCAEPSYAINEAKEASVTKVESNNGCSAARLTGVRVERTNAASPSGPTLTQPCDVRRQPGSSGFPGTNGATTSTFAIAAPPRTNIARIANARCTTTSRDEEEETSRGKRWQCTGRRTNEARTCATKSKQSSSLRINKWPNVPVVFWLRR
jgi:hypothetical protein